MACGRFKFTKVAASFQLIRALANLKPATTSVLEVLPVA